MATSRQLRDEIAAGRRDAALAALYGGSKSVLARQRSRYCAALDQFELYYGPGRQVRVYSAPGRTELGGNHTDHQHGYGLAGAVTLDLVAVASRNEDGFIRVKSRGFNKLDVIDLTEAEPQQGESTHSASLIRGIADGFRTKGFGIGGFDAYTASDVLRGSGLSSSAAFEMGMAVILNTEYGCGLDAPALARICQFAENAYFGKPSGLLDQLTSAVGGVLFADFADPTAPKIEKIHADGVHLGKKDMPVAEARKMLGKDFIIGGTANTFEDVKMHYEAGADYIGCGPFRFTTTKKNLSPILGLEGYRSIVSQMKEAGIHLPIVAIGGITFEDIPSIMATGVTGIALSGTILRADNPIEETRRIINIEKINNK